MASIFSRIIAGEIPCYKIAENDSCIAFLDIFPLKRGHVLIVPKEETDHWHTLSPELSAEVWAFARQVAAAIREAIPSERIGIVVAGFEVPHVHIHLIPVDTMEEMNFHQPKLQLSKEEMETIAAGIQKHLTQE